jgi:hypothetical protein
MSNGMRLVPVCPMPNNDIERQQRWRSHVISISIGVRASALMTAAVLGTSSRPFVSGFSRIQAGT